MTQELIIVLTQPRLKNSLGSLAAAFPRDIEVIAYTCFGDLFLRDVGTSQIAIAYICSFELIPVAAKSVEALRQLLDANPQAKDELLKPAKVAQLVERLGPLSDEETYVPYPLPMWGGDGSIESYRKGNLWAHIELVTA